MSKKWLFLKVTRIDDRFQSRQPRSRTGPIPQVVASVKIVLARVNHLWQITRKGMKLLLIYFKVTLFPQKDYDLSTKVTSFYLLDFISFQGISEWGIGKKKEKEKIILGPKCMMCSFFCLNYSTNTLQV